MRYDRAHAALLDRKSTRLNSSHLVISYAVFCLKKKNNFKDGKGRPLHSFDCVRGGPEIPAQLLSSCGRNFNANQSLFFFFYRVGDPKFLPFSPNPRSTD